MTFAAYENSVESSKPIEYYRFIIGSTTFEYTSAEDAVAIGSLTYHPEAITREAIQQGPEDRASVLTIKVPSSNTFAQLYTNIIPGKRARVVISRVQRPDFPIPEAASIFQGYVQSVSFSDHGKVASIAVTPIEAASSRSIPRFTYQGLCNHVLYDARCKKLASDFKFTGLVSAVSGNVITVTGANAFPDDYFTAGFAESFGGVDDRMILDHVGNNLTLLLPFAASVLGSNIDLYAGCFHDLDTCVNKFNNGINYGGFFFIPVKNPFNTGL